MKTHNSQQADWKVYFQKNFGFRMGIGCDGKRTY